MEFVRALKCLDHLSSLERVYADRAIGLVSVLGRATGRGLLIAEGGKRVDDVSDLLGRELLFFLFLCVVLLLIRIHVLLSISL